LILEEPELTSVDPGRPVQTSVDPGRPVQNQNGHQLIMEETKTIIRRSCKKLELTLVCPGRKQNWHQSGVLEEPELTSIGPGRNQPRSDISIGR
jgi:hypothetical protein